MSTRPSTSFAPKEDEFTAFSADLITEAEAEIETTTQSWFTNAAKYLFSPSDPDTTTSGTTDQQFHELMTCVLDHGNNINPSGDNESQKEILKGLNVEKYVLSYLPTHLIRAQMFDDVCTLLIDFEFIDQRIKMLGILEATKRHMSDLTDLRRQVQRKSKEDKIKLSEKNPDPPSSPKIDQLKSMSTDSSIVDSPSQTQESGKYDINVTRTQREACRRMIDAVRRTELQSSASGSSTNIATCLSIVAEFLLKARITRDAVSRFQEALELFQKIFGESHVDVARALNSLAKAYMKAGEERLALLKSSEAHHVYESCNALHQYDAISNNLLMAALLVDSGDWDNATLKYDEVISMKREVYGSESVVVAKTINDYAIVLAKNSRMSESLRQYEIARDVYIATNTEDRFSFDITLIELNIASIKSKLGNYRGALESYERGVTGLRVQIEKEKNELEGLDSNRLAAQRRHLVSAMGRIGSMRMKLKDNAGALKAYLTLIKEVGKKSPTPSQMEKARAHVKCATIFRQTSTKENNALAISHLSQALQMYTILHGVNHKDTKAIGSSLRQWQKIDSSMET
jgi:tetratricopeptide (TPR) repeat protein